MSKKLEDFLDHSLDDLESPPVLGLGKAASEDLPKQEDIPSEVGSPEQEAIDTIAERIIEELRGNESIRPKNWSDVLRGLELVLKFKHELHGKHKKGEQDLAYQALQEFKEVVDAFSRFESK
ncbi:hypothetical protein J7J18_06870 [bacterium]|nr:hypothetical protein [bacterium]